MDWRVCAWDVIDAVDETVRCEMVRASQYLPPIWDGVVQIDSVCLHLFATYLEPTCVRCKVSDKYGTGRSTYQPMRLSSASDDVCWPRDGMLILSELDQSETRGRDQS